ncbi:uncharacterized protein LOC134609340 [Pelobates fuscus]|uniref:uncharacterized protein LOC134609340 n=1 Tax=Pelobates fuscus TaxID=191477 RepID=UPI002FE499B4
MAERFASEKNQMFPVISRETTHGKASNIRARPQKNTSSGIKLPPCPNNRIPMLTTKPSEKVDFIRAPLAEQFVSVPSGVKFPVSPKQPVQFCTTKLSEKLYKPSPSFDLEDPYCRLMRTTYNNLHDPCLKEYYQSKIPRQRIRQQGFITSDDKASNIRARPTQKNTSSGIKLPPCPNNRIPMLTTKPSEKVDFIRAPPAEQFVSVPSGVKFPVSPKQPVQFCTTKLSEKLYKPSPSFDLEDPYCRLMRTTYNNLHDPCLKAYYQSKIPRQRIRQQGFITSDDKKLEKQDRENSSSTNDNPKLVRKHTS